jgi:hypothetical protein
MDFHGKFRGIPWNSVEFHEIVHGIFHGIFNGIFHVIQFHGKFHEITERFSPGKGWGSHCWSNIYKLQPRGPEFCLSVLIIIIVPNRAMKKLKEVMIIIHTK